MSPLARGPSEAGDRQQANASTEPTPDRHINRYSCKRRGMTYLTRGPVGTTGIGSKGHASKAPTPVRAQIVDATGGDGMSNKSATGYVESSTSSGALP